MAVIQGTGLCRVQGYHFAKWLSFKELVSAACKAEPPSKSEAKSHKK
jgi:hypothetical protein